MTRRVVLSSLILLCHCSSSRAGSDGGVDSGVADAGVLDAGSDAGPIDAGMDAGCPTGSHECADGCHLVTDVNACGGSCAPCPAVANGTPTCLDGTACGVACDVDAGAHQCGSLCPIEDQTSCGPSCESCPTPPSNAFAVCVDGACAVACSGDFVSCTVNPAQCGHLAGGASSQCQVDTDCCSLHCEGTTGAGQCCEMIGSQCAQAADCSTYACSGSPTQVTCGDAGTCCVAGGGTCTQASDCCSNKCGFGNFCD